MFKNKLLKALLAPFFVFVDDEGGGGGDFNMEAASAAISEGLFGGSNDTDNSGDDLDLDLGAPGSDADDNPGDLAPPSGDKAPVDPAKPEGTDPAATPADAPAKAEVPKTWRPEAAAEWEKLPPVAQQEILKREADIFKGIEALKPDASIGKAFQTALKPFEQFMINTKTDPVGLTRELVQAHATLSIGTAAEKLAVIQRISAAYGVPLTAAEPDGEAPYVDPQVKALQDEIKAVKSQLSGTAERQAAEDAQKQTQIREQLMGEIEAFANDPANKHYALVEADMSKLLSAGTAKDLKDAYEQAVWLNPTSRAAEQARITAEAAQKLQAEKLEKAKAAAKASSANVRTSAKQASGTALMGSIDDTLKEALKNINSRG